MDRADEPAGRDVELTSVAPPPRRRWGLLGVYAAVIAIVLGGAWGLAVRDDPTAEPPGTTVAPPSTEQRSAAELLAIMPASPIDGKQSQRLPVLATTQSELVDGQIVTVLAKGFEPGERVGAVLCTAEAALEGVNACDLGRNGSFDLVTYANASPEGFVQVDLAARTLIETPFNGAVDCLVAAERCIIAVGAVGDYDRSGGTAIGFSGQPAFPEPTLIVSGGAPYEPGTVVDVVGSGLLWPREVEVQLCTDDEGGEGEAACATLARDRVAADGTYVGSVGLPSSFVLADGTVVSCEAGCALRLGYVALAGTSRAPEPLPYPVAFSTSTPPTEQPPVSIVPATPEQSSPPPTVATTTDPGTLPPPGTSLAPTTLG